MKNAVKVTPEMNLEIKLDEILNQNEKPEDFIPSYKKQNIERVIEHMSIFFHFLKESFTSKEPKRSSLEMIGLIEQAALKLRNLNEL